VFPGGTIVLSKFWASCFTISHMVASAALLTGADGTGTDGRTPLGSLELLNGQGEADQEKGPSEQ